MPVTYYTEQEYDELKELYDDSQRMLVNSLTVGELQAFLSMPKKKIVEEIAFLCDQLLQCNWINHKDRIRMLALQVRILKLVKKAKK